MRSTLKLVIILTVPLLIFHHNNWFMNTNFASTSFWYFFMFMSIIWINIIIDANIKDIFSKEWKKNLEYRSVIQRISYVFRRFFGNKHISLLVKSMLLAILLAFLPKYGPEIFSNFEYLFLPVVAAYLLIADYIGSRIANEKPIIFSILNRIKK